MNLPALATPATGFGVLLCPSTFKEAREFAELLAKSDLVPKAYLNKPGDIMIAAAMGARLGLDIFSALAGIATINGKPSLYGDAMLAVCQAHPAWVDIQETMRGTIAGKDAVALCVVQRKGKAPYPTSFSMEDAHRAGLLNKQGPWSTVPQRMLAMRARAFALRGAFADALSGFHMREELDDDEPRQVESGVRAELPRVNVAEPQEARTGALQGVVNDNQIKDAADPLGQKQEPPKDEKPAEEKKGPHPAIAAGRDLWNALGHNQDATEILERMAKLHGSENKKATGIPADRLDAFGVMVNAMLDLMRDGAGWKPFTGVTLAPVWAMLQDAEKAAKG